MKSRDPHQLQIDWIVRLTEPAKPPRPKPPDEVVLLTVETTNPFIFNKHEVCTNPEVLEIYKSSQDFAMVELAQEPHGMWCYGYQFRCYQGGSTSGASYGKYRKTYPTRHDALLKALDWALEWSEKYQILPKLQESKSYEKFYKAVKKFKETLTK